MNFKACIYNLDGAIADTTKYHYESWKRIADHLGYNLTPKQNQKLRLGSKRDALEKILKWSLNRISEAEKQELLSTKNKLYMEFIEKIQPTDILEGFKAFNNELREKGIKVAVSSSSKNAIRIIDKLDLVLDFDAIVDGGMLTQSSWSSVERFELAAQKLGVMPNETVLFQSGIGPVKDSIDAGFQTMVIGEYPNGGAISFKNWFEVNKYFEDSLLIKEPASNQPG